MDLFLITVFTLGSFLTYWRWRGIINDEIMRLLPPVILPVILVFSTMIENLQYFFAK